MTKRLIPLCAAAALIPHAAVAHHVAVGVGSQTAGPIVTASPLTLPRGKWAAAVQLRILNFDSFSDSFLEDTALAGEEDVHNLDSIITPSVAVAYGVTDNLEIDLQLAYFDRNGVREAELVDGMAELDVLGGTDGIGDLTALARYRVLDGGDDGLTATILAALQMPTGKTSEKDNFGVPFEAEFQPGTGAWSPSIGYALEAPVEHFTFTTSGIYTFAGRGTQHTDLGDRFNFGAAFAYKLGPGEHHHDDEEMEHEEHAHSSWDLIVELTGEWQQRERFGPEINPQSGGTQLFVAPGVRYSSAAGWGAYVSVGLPVFQDLNGIQNKTDFRMTAGLGFVF